MALTVEKLDKHVDRARTTINTSVGVIALVVAIGTMVGVYNMSELAKVLEDSRSLLSNDRGSLSSFRHYVVVKLVSDLDTILGEFSHNLPDENMLKRIEEKLHPIHLLLEEDPQLSGAGPHHGEDLAMLALLAKTSDKLLVFRRVTRDGSSGILVAKERGSARRSGNRWR